MSLTVRSITTFAKGTSYTYEKKEKRRFPTNNMMLLKISVISFLAIPTIILASGSGVILASGSGICESETKVLGDQLQGTFDAMFQEAETQMMASMMACIIASEPGHCTVQMDASKTDKSDTYEQECDLAGGTIEMFNMEADCPGLTDGPYLSLSITANNIPMCASEACNGNDVPAYFKNAVNTDMDGQSDCTVVFMPVTTAGGRSAAVDAMFPEYPWVWLITSTVMNICF